MAGSTHILTASQTGIIIFLTGFSSVLFVVSAVYFFLSIFRHKDYSFNRRILYSAIWLLAVIFFMRMAVLYYNGYICGAYADYGPMSGFLQLLGSSFTNALQSFSMDEDYDSFLADGQQMFRDIGWILGGKIYILICVLSDIIAPVAGGAIVLDILTGIFPKLYLFNHAHSHKYVFSCLNDRAVCLAEDIAGIKEKHVIIFTSTDDSDDDDDDGALIQRAKKIGAVCLHEDILHLKFRHAGEIDYYFIDEDEDINTHNLTMIANNASKEQWLWNEYRVCRILLFTDRSGDYDIAKTAGSCFNAAIEKMCKENAASGSGKTRRPIPPDIKLIFGYENRALTLFGQVPLYQPLRSKYGFDPSAPAKGRLTREEFVSLRKELTVTILGFGRIGRQMFRTAYWCSQMLNVNVHFNIVDNSGTFDSDCEGTMTCAEAYVRRHCPELMATTVPDSEILRCNYPRDDAAQPVYTEPYCSVKFYDIDVSQANLESFFSDDEGGSGIINTDYFIVTLGSDELNGNTAAEIKKCIGRHQIGEKQPERKVIAYVIYDDELMKMLRSRYANARADDEGALVNMYPFGSLGECYSYENVYFGDYLCSYASGHGSAVRNQSGSDMGLSISSVFESRRKDSTTNQYNFGSSVARAVHLRYKIFSVGLSSKNGMEEYLRLIGQGDNDELTWLEHRRWNAYLRSKGFVSSLNYSSAGTGQNEIKVPKKNFYLKIHPCLVESALGGCTVRPCKPVSQAGTDMLDYVGDCLGTKYKVYDNPDYDFKDCSVTEIFAYLGWKKDDTALRRSFEEYIDSEDRSYREFVSARDAAKQGNRALPAYAGIVSPRNPLTGGIQLNNIYEWMVNNSVDSAGLLDIIGKNRGSAGPPGA